LWLLHAQAPVHRAQLHVVGGRTSGVKEQAAPQTLLILVGPQVGMDTNATAWIAGYADLHADTMRGAVPVEQRRFLVWSCRPMGVCGGLGNRIVNIVAAFALAILTDRAFVIDYPGSSPLELEAFARSDLIDWRMPAWFEHAPFSEGSAVVSIMHEEIYVTDPVVEERRAFNKQVRAVQAH